MTTDVELRSLHCFEVSDAYFQPVEGFDSFPSLINLELIAGDLTALVESHFLIPAVLPTLRLFYAYNIALDKDSIPLSLTHPSPLYARWYGRRYRPSTPLYSATSLTGPLLLHSAGLPLQLPLRHTVNRNSHARL